ncbi:guanylate kinase [Trichormus variabilis ATCC 29413]|uniref:Guanylate kinase n=2 Tax=Anabaena variabilis TaxID=264691 RepID=KGUA_TRIV2|nr:MULTISPECIES: guanylate kinase [Nostocaceae]Q3MD38.1 RecName: Full=Guanylate kinase; AltName: Full=GMP kinase [Trichormus variabilis ATCC 29413]ABA21098.1 guanylate kinase [Trichormus variabilis ATCC 29413]MBC1215450.1 guanylate kinase [Trichormus variabilis ARAD]MBC1256479.1 guanylate kinase [Trichormus variabilis V5]MBC1267923.1 guanylate kinase [Trichormus variabilis FSR]MBC1302363.1 guanylate kinase [Trichormus variabilis N2B]
MMQVLSIQNCATTKENPSSGKLIVLTGPSGVGKGTLMRSLLQRHPELYYSVSATTRAPRPGEVNGESYYFISRNKFEELLAQGEFLESAEFAGNYYGTPREAVLNQIQSGKLVVLEIELAGARQIRASFPEALSIFILPPSFEELEKRIRGRGQDSEEAIARRLQRATEEIQAADEFDIQIVNDDFEAALQAIEVALFG